MNRHVILYMRFRLFLAERQGRMWGQLYWFTQLKHEGDERAQS